MGEEIAFLPCETLVHDEIDKHILSVSQELTYTRRIEVHTHRLNWTQKFALSQEFVNETVARK